MSSNAELRGGGEGDEGDGGGVVSLKITDFRNVLLNPIFQRECNFADRQLSSKSM